MEDWYEESSFNTSPIFVVAETNLESVKERKLRMIADGHEIELTAKEFDILALIIFNPRRVFTNEMISDIVWNEEYNENSRKAINNHISNLRRKLKTTPDIPNYIKSVHSVGYKFEPQE